MPLDQATSPRHAPGDNFALTTGTLPGNATGVPADKNPNVGGATGKTIVPGNKSTISGDKERTTQEKTGATK